jgi:uncharacterized protein (TIGR02600 family)
MPLPGHPRKRRAAALIIVVAFIVLLSAMVIAFFSRVTNDLADTRTYSESVSARQLADSAIGVVMGQIREATTVKNGAWASQPGMIRVYRSPDGQPGPEVHAFYKLFSSHDLIVSRNEVEKYDIGVYNVSASDDKIVEVPLGKGGWRDQPAFFTDVNEAAVVSLTNVHGVPTGKTARVHPIFNPAVAALHEPGLRDPKTFERVAKVEGAEIELSKELRDESNEAPMPVRWIYMLRDGTLTAPVPIKGPATGEKGRVARWEALNATGGKTGVPTKTNPIVGRIAFWADDDTNKVNINIAGGFLPTPDVDEDLNPAAAMAFAGSYWDTPRMQTQFDRGTHDPNGQLKTGGLANAQPSQNEFQRYPGHPSTTSLGLVFKRLIPPIRGFDSEKLYAWLPRLTPGGSMGGRFRLDTTLDRELPIKSAVEPDPEGRTYHMWATPDEMVFSSLNGDRLLAEQALGLPSDTISPDIFDLARPFLTAHSRSPELNLFGLPRVTIWPVWNEPAGMDPRDSRNNPSDNLIRFCSTVGKREFLFAREKPYSTTYDFNLGRNRAIFNYLRDRTSRTTGRIPGFGGSFEEKLAAYPGGRDQLLAEIFDYIRTVNLKDTTRFREIEAGVAASDGRQTEKERFMYAPKGIVVPTHVDVDGKQVSGFGRFPTISEASLVFYFAGAVVKERNNPSAKELTVYDGSILESKAFADKYVVVANLVRAFLVLETFNPMQGYAPVNKLDRANEVLVHEITFDNGFALTSASNAQAQPLGFKNGSNRISRSSGDTWGGRNFGGTEGFLHTMRDKSEIYTDKNDDATDPLPKCDYPFRSSTAGVRVPAGDKFFNFSGGKLTLSVKMNNDTVQTIRLDFPAANDWPMPTAQVWKDAGGFDKSAPGANPKSRRDWASFFERRLSWVVMSKNGTKSWEWDHSYSPWDPKNNGDGLNYENRWRNILQPGDTIRSLIPGRADKPDLTDPRLIALSREPGNLFFPHPDYASAKPRATTLRRADGAFYLGGADAADNRVVVKPVNQSLNGSLIDLPGTRAYGGNKGPDLPAGVIARRADGKPADFDTGIGNYPDGAFSGKADEGNVVWRWFDNNTGNWNLVEPYFSTAAYDPPMDTFFSPNRQIPSAVMLGSLLSRRSGWETLLFSPNPAGENHPGAKSPRDHLLLDLFTMPVVEPFAISEPFSSEGKVNLNYAIAPFGYLKRTTALRAALHPLRVTAMPQTAVDRYKSKDNPENYRYLVDRDETLRGFDEFFDEYKKDRSKGFFKSASEICDRYLYPKGETHAGNIAFRGKSENEIRQTFWKNSALTGDNVREKPYADLYPRITTKSNTYTVHYRVQTLRKVPYTGPQGGEDEYYRTWDESRDKVLAEYRGSSTIERYLDPEDERFKANYSKGDRIDVEHESLEDAYRFRVIYHKRFSPW